MDIPLPHQPSSISPWYYTVEEGHGVSTHSVCMVWWLFIVIFFTEALCLMRLIYKWTQSICFTFFAINYKTRNLFSCKQGLTLYHSLWANSAGNKIDIFFFIFPRKQDLTFHTNCLQFAWNVKSCFLGKIRTIFQNVISWKFYPVC